MKLTAQYENGVLITEHPIHPKTGTLHLIILDDELDSEATPPARLEEWQKEILSRMPWMEQVWNPDPGEYVSDDQLTEEEKERMIAFEAAEKYRIDDGRTL